jgi:hypothetical protein
MEHIKLEFHHISIKNPLVKFVINGKIYKNLEVKNNDPIMIECDVSDGLHVIEIYHYGKNYELDSDKSFELTKMKINDVDTKYEIFKFKQYPDLPPWEKWHHNNEVICWENNLHLGHNGKIVYSNFSTPSVAWFKNLFGTVYQPIGMKSNEDVLNFAKNFIIEKKNNGLS